VKLPVVTQPEITSFLQERIDANDFPSAVYLIAEKGEVRFRDAIGHAVVEPDVIPATQNTIYDLASLTKVLMTGLLVAQLLERGSIVPEDVAANFLGGTDSGATVRELLTHTSGYRGWLPLYALPGSPGPGPGERHVETSSPELDLRRDFVTQAILREPRAEEPRVVYSDLNFVLLGRLVEQSEGAGLRQVVMDRVIDRLSLHRTFCGSVGRLRRETAASEKGNEFERQTCVELGYIAPEQVTSVFRRDVIWGEVHDCNAYYMGGLAGHAGLFATADDVLKIALQFLPAHTSLLRPETCELFTTNYTPGMDEHRSFAFQLASTPESTAGKLMSPQSFGHLGFTGTSLWIDPVTERIFILLANRTHAHKLPFVNINSVRRRFHDLAIQALDGNL